MLHPGCPHSLLLRAPPSSLLRLTVVVTARDWMAGTTRGSPLPVAIHTCLVLQPSSAAARCSLLCIHQLQADALPAGPCQSSPPFAPDLVSCLESTSPPCAGLALGAPSLTAQQLSTPPALTTV